MKSCHSSWGDVLTDERYKVAFFVVEVFVGVSRQLLDGGAELLSQARFSTARPQWPDGLNLVDRFGDVRMFGLRLLQSVATAPCSVMQFRPQQLILGVVVVVEHRDHVREVVPDECRSASVARREGANQAGQVAELAAERAMDHRHLERIAWHR
jgi:hypothetical protein